MDLGLGGLLSFDNLNGPVQFGYDVFNNERNFRYQRQQWDYQKDLQNRIFQREDNAVQRRAADLKAAGFNPLLAAGGAASSGQAVSTSAPNVAGLKFDYAAYRIAKARADVDISMTKSQQELINQQALQAKKQNELTDLTIQWYKDHPNYAPGIESGFHTGKGLSSLFDFSSARISNIKKDFRNLREARKVYPRDYQRAYDFHINNGLSPKEADRRARQFVASQH